MPTAKNARAHTARSARPARPVPPALPPFAELDETHRRIMQILAELERLPGLLTQPDRGPETAALAARACAFFGHEARHHHETEETLVFPSLLEGADTGLRAQVLRLQQDHNWIEEDWLELEPHLQAVAQGWRQEHEAFLRDTLPEFTALQHEHIALEESLIYPEAKRRQAVSPSSSKRSPQRMP